MKTFKVRGQNENNTKVKRPKVHFSSFYIYIYIYLKKKKICHYNINGNLEHLYSHALWVRNVLILSIKKILSTYLDIIIPSVTMSLWPVVEPEMFSRGSPNKYVKKTF